MRWMLHERTKIHENGSSPFICIRHSSSGSLQYLWTTTGWLQWLHRKKHSIIIRPSKAITCSCIPEHLHPSQVQVLTNRRQKQNVFPFWSHEWNRWRIMWYLHGMWVLKGMRDHLEGISGGTDKSCIRITSLVSHYSVTYLNATEITLWTIEWNSHKMIPNLSFYQIDEEQKALHSKLKWKTLKTFNF